MYIYIYVCYLYLYISLKIIYIYIYIIKSYRINMYIVHIVCIYIYSLVGALCASAAPSGPARSAPPYFRKVVGGVFRKRVRKVFRGPCSEGCSYVLVY